LEKSNSIFFPPFPLLKKWSKTYKKVTKKLQKSYKKVTKKLQKSYKKVTKKLQKSYKKVTKKLQKGWFGTTFFKGGRKKLNYFFPRSSFV